MANLSNRNQIRALANTSKDLVDRLNSAEKSLATGAINKLVADQYDQTGTCSTSITYTEPPHVKDYKVL